MGRHDSEVGSEELEVDFLAEVVWPFGFFAWFGGWDFFKNLGDEVLRQVEVFAEVAGLEIMVKCWDSGNSGF